MVLVVADSLHDGAIFPLVQIIQLTHILLTDLKPIHIRIFLDASRVITLRQRHPVLLQTVPDQNLCGRPLVLLRQRRQRLVVRFVVADERAVGLDDDAVLLAVLVDRALLAPGV